MYAIFIYYQQMFGYVCTYYLYILSYMLDRYGCGGASVYLVILHISYLKLKKNVNIRSLVYSLFFLGKISIKKSQYEENLNF